MIRTSGKRIGDILISKGLLTSEKLKDALDEQSRTKEFLGTILIRKRYIPEKDLLSALSEQFSMPVEGLKDAYIDWDVVKRFDPSLILGCKCFPFRKDDSAVVIAVTDPLDVTSMRKAENSVRPAVSRFALAPAEDMEDALKRYKRFMRRALSDMFLNKDI